MFLCLQSFVRDCRLFSAVKMLTTQVLNGMMGYVALPAVLHRIMQVGSMLVLVCYNASSSNILERIFNAVLLCNVETIYTIISP